MKHFEIERLLRAFGRKAHEHTMDAYQEFVREYDSEQVRKAVEHAINKSDKLPPPAELRKFCTIGLLPEKAGCDFCKDKGFTLVGGGEEYDAQGFRYIAFDHPVLCKCGAAAPPPANGKAWAHRDALRVWHLARLLAKEVGRRAAGSELTRDLRAWRQVWWIDKEIPEWVEEAKKLGGLVGLVRLSELLAIEDPNDCAEIPFRVCKRLIPIARSKKETGILGIFKSVVG
jgi:hypothetical protein